MHSSWYNYPLAQAAQLLAQLPQTGGTDYIEVFVVYLVATQERRTVQEFVERVQCHALDVGGSMLTYQSDSRHE